MINIYNGKDGTEKNASNSERDVESGDNRITIDGAVLTELLDSVREGIVLVGCSGRVLFANSSFCRFTGVGKDKVVGVDFKELLESVFGFDDARFIYDNFSSCQKTTIECRTVSCGKGHQIFKVKMSPVESHLCQSAVEVMFTDISVQRRTQEKLSESRTLYQAVFDGAGDSVFVSNSNGRFIEANLSACESLGYTREELLGLNASDLLSHQYCRRIPEQILNLIEGGQVFFEVEYVRKDGSVFPAEISSRMIDLGGKKACLTISRDISERKRAERDSNLSRLRFKALYELSHMSEGSQESICEFSLNKGLEISLSKAGFICRVEGSGQDSKIVKLFACEGGNFCSSLSESLEMETGGILLKCIRTRKPVIMNQIPLKIVEDMLPGIKFAPVRGLAIPILDSGRVVAVIGVFDKETPYIRRDVHNLQLLVEGMWQIICKKESELKVRASLREKETLLREVHHRVKNNMQVISSLLNLQIEYIHDPEDLSLIRHSMERVRSMAYVHEHLYRSDNLSRINFAAYIEYLGDRLFKAYGCDHRIEFITNLEPIELSIDQALPCGLIVNELITNAINHAFPKFFAGDNRFVKVQLFREGENVVLKVQDNGVGYDPDAKSEGSLGLTLVETLVSQLGGTISGVCPYSTCYRLSFKLK